MADLPGDRPPKRQLDHAPSDRFGPPPAEPSAEAASSAPSDPRAAAVRGFLFSLPAALIALFVYMVFAGPLAFSAGLVFIGIFAGRVVGLTVKVGGGSALTSDRRVVIALLVTLGWFVVSQFAIWAYARSEGGDLAPLDYLFQAFGPVVPLVLVAAVLAAWWSAR